jgi:hypothetical protein
MRKALVSVWVASVSMRVVTSFFSLVVDRSMESRTDEFWMNPQERPHPSVAVAGVLPREGDHPLEQSAILIGLPTLVALAGPGLSDHPASPTLGDPKPPPNMLDGRPPLGRAQELPRRGVLRTSQARSYRKFCAGPTNTSRTRYGHSRGRSFGPGLWADEESKNTSVELVAASSAAWGSGPSCSS